MDTSETYIKMCDCPEIQKLSPGDKELLLIIQRGKPYWDKKGNCFFRPYPEMPTWISGISQPIWLPRQDQIQEMLDPKPYPGMFLKFVKFLGWDGISWDSHNYPNWGNISCFSSMEQLWLAFLMKEKFNKSWNGKEWCEKLV